MNGILPKIVVKPREEPCISTTVLEDEMYLVCRLDYPLRKKSPENLSDTIAVSFGTEWQSYRVVADMSDFLFSKYHGEDDYRLDETYCYTNPKLWPRASSLASPPRSDPVYFEFDLPGEKIDTRTLGAEFEIVFDEENCRVAYAFSEVMEDCRTFAVADNLLIQCDENFSLCQIIFCDLTFRGDDR